MSRSGSRTCNVLLLLLFFLISGFVDAAAGTRMGGSFLNKYLSYIVYYIVYIISYIYILLYCSTRTRTLSIVFRTRRRRRRDERIPPIYLTYNNIRQVVFINIRHFLFYLSHTRCSSVEVCLCVCVVCVCETSAKTDGRAGCVVR